MAPEFSYEPRTMNDKSSLHDGWCPAFLLAITDEPTPAGWQMAEKSPRMWRWHFAVWPTATAVGRPPGPEHQSAPSSQTFSPGGKQPASKAYLWTLELLDRQEIRPGERVNLEPFLPLPCRVKIRRKEEYANIVDLEKWPEGAATLTPELRTALQEFYDHPSSDATAATPPVQSQTPTPQPGMQTWARPASTPTPQPATTAKPTW